MILPAPVEVVVQWGRTAFYYTHQIATAIFGWVLHQPVVFLNWVFGYNLPPMSESEFRRKYPKYCKPLPPERKDSI